MRKFNFTGTFINGLYAISPTVYDDSRGYFLETYNYRDFKNEGFDMEFVQDNQSKSIKGTLRGLHYQRSHQQGKLVRVISGEVFDVVVDLRNTSSTYGKWYGMILSCENKKQLYIPEGFAHGFLVLSDTAEFSYKCTDYYYPDDEDGLLWNDPGIGIEWPLDSIPDIILSDKDKRWNLLSETMVKL